MIIIVILGSGIGGFTAFLIALLIIGDSIKQSPNFALTGAIIYGAIGWIVGHQAREYSISQSPTAQAFRDAGLSANAFAPQTMGHFVVSGIIAGTIGFAIGKAVCSSFFGTSNKIFVAFICNLCAGIPFAILSFWWLLSMHGI